MFLCTLQLYYSSVLLYFNDILVNLRFLVVFQPIRVNCIISDKVESKIE